jgi:hypothetical protein
MGFKLLQGPSIEPVTVDEVKMQARVPITADDALIAIHISAARELVEKFLRRKLITQKWRMYLDAFPGYIDQRLGGNIVTAPIAIGATSYMAGIRWAIVPPWPPVQSVDAVAFLGPDGTTVTMTENVDYLVDKVSNPARITPPFGKFWPISRIQVNSVWVDTTVGYGDTAAAVPASARLAILQTCTDYYVHRGDDADPTGTMMQLSQGAIRLLSLNRDLRM